MTNALVAARVASAAATHPGRLRASNEDRYYVDADRGVFLVVDGVGGQAAGEVAAAIAVDVIAQRLERPLGTPTQRVREAIALANNEILRQAQRSPAYKGMTCVLTLALAVEDRLVIGHVGDSRLYKIAPEGLRKLTHDHSPVGEREDALEISEADAMRHPRRSEVFRDVGSTFRDPDDPDFIEIVDASFASDAAILLCSDGLSDMLPSASIELVVRQHAGDPDRVVSTLVEAANAAGGKDNVTVVYAEGADFARFNAAPAVAPATEPLPGRERPRLRRAVWLGLGLLLGVLGGLVAGAWLPFAAASPPPAPRTLIVGQGGGARYPTIAAAVRAAVPGDVVRIEPGEYGEAVLLKDGVDLVARVPGTVTLVAPSGYGGSPVITVNGRQGSRLAGLRLLGRPAAPLAVGLHLSGSNVIVDDVTIEGAVLLGMDVAAGGAMTIRASHFGDVEGLPLRIGPAARPSVRQNIFARTAAAPRGAAIEVADSAAPHVAANLFVGYPTALQWTGAAPHVLRDNFFLPGAADVR